MFKEEDDEEVGETKNSRRPWKENQNIIQVGASWGKTGNDHEERSLDINEGGSRIECGGKEETKLELEGT